MNQPLKWYSSYSLCVLLVSAMTTPAVFNDRQEAGRRLYAELARLDLPHKDIVVLALPRGGVPVAFEVAQLMRVPMDLLLVRRIRAPIYADNQLGAIADGREPKIYQQEVAAANMNAEYVNRELTTQLEEIARQKQAYFGDRQPLPLYDRIAIVIDDGFATLANAHAVTDTLRAKSVRQIIYAAPLGLTHDIEYLLTEEGLRVICVHTPPNFSPVRPFYAEFEKVTDQEVVGCIQRAKEWMQQ